MAFQKAREFTIDRLCYSLFHTGDSSNDAVTEWLKQVAEEDESKSMQEVVRLVSQMLKLSPNDRPTAAQVTVRLYISTLRTISETLLALFASLPLTLECIIEKSRFLCWIVCQDAELYLSMAGATNSHKIFEVTVELLC